MPWVCQHCFSSYDFVSSVPLRLISVLTSTIRVSTYNKLRPHTHRQQTVNIHSNTALPPRAPPSHKNLRGKTPTHLEELR